VRPCSAATSKNVAANCTAAGIPGAWFSNGNGAQSQPARFLAVGRMHSSPSLRRIQRSAQLVAEQSPELYKALTAIRMLTGETGIAGTS
jgi:hypothetical protein